MDPACGAAAVSTLLARGARFSALVASNDDMAIGAIKRLHEAGVMVPDEVSVVGFDDIPWPLTSFPRCRASRCR